MKREHHLGAWLLGTFVLETALVDALLKQITFSAVARSTFQTDYLQAFLVLDAGFGACLLPVMGALRRGSRQIKVAGLMLALPPLLYICMRIYTFVLPLVFLAR